MSSENYPGHSDSSATYIPFGSFQVPQQQRTQLPCNSRELFYESSLPKVVTPPIQEPTMKVQAQYAQYTAKPLQACPGLPQPNQEMRYFSWKSVGKCNSSVDLTQMTHRDHSAPAQQPPAKSAFAGPVKDENNNVGLNVNDAEMHAALTLSSCFKNGMGMAEPAMHQTRVMRWCTIHSNYSSYDV